MATPNPHDPYDDDAMRRGAWDVYDRSPDGHYSLATTVAQLTHGG